MEMTLSELRAKIFKTFDELIRTGRPVVIRRSGRRVTIVPEIPGGRLERLKERPGLEVPAEELDQVSWSDAWSEAPAHADLS